MFGFFKSKVPKLSWDQLFTHGSEDKSYSPCPMCYEALAKFDMLDYVIKSANVRISALEKDKKELYHLWVRACDEIDDMIRDAITDLDSDLSEGER